jgi:ATP-binding cassette subfamily F protein 3
MYNVINLGVRFSGESLFSGITFLINEKDRIGLTGKNGAGKTTLLNILAQKSEPTEGNILIPKFKKVGYLPQHMSAKSKLNILQETLLAFEEVVALEKSLEILTHQIHSRTDYESSEYLNLIEALNHANDRLHLLDAQSRLANTEKVLIGLGFDPSEFEKPVEELSGGWKMRIELAKILLKKPDLILLDEPTNHLDIESIMWLEDFLSNYQGAVILVSHDRAFLDAVTTRTIEITKGRIYDYKTNYSGYVLQRKVLMDQQIAKYNNQQKEIKEVEDFIERFRYKATKAKQVQSRIKQLEKIDNQEVDLIDKKSIHFKFPPAPNSGKVVVEAKSYAKSYGSKVILKPLDFTMLKNEFVAFVGRNGEGKSTLAKSILQLIEFDGQINLGYNVKIGYYAQNQADTLDENLSVFDTIDHVAVGDIRKQVKSILGSFLFSGEDIDKKVKVLSGGERSRLALAKLLLEPVNLLVLDEPTNHLDMQSKDILKSALLNYDGTLIIVSHDRDFLLGLCSKTVEFKNQTIKEHLGGIEEFLEKRKLENLQQLEFKEKNNLSQQKEISDNKMQFLEKKENDKQLRKLKKEIEKIEQLIEETENEIALLDQQLSNPNESIVFDEVFFKNYESKKETVTQLLEQWELLHTEMEPFIDR